MALGWNGLSESLAQTGVRQHEIVIGLEQHPLLTQPVFALTRCRTAPPHRRDPLTQAQLEPLDKGRMDVPAASRSDLIHHRLRAEHAVVLHRDEAPPSHGLDDLCREERGQRHPARLACRASGLVPR
jgi:hypothetical protein